jgi:hypothetical protein
LQASDIVARTLLPGPIVPVSVARMLSVPAADLPACMKPQIGDQVAVGDLLARSPGIFGWFPVECPSPAAGTIESISHVTGQVLIREAPRAIELPAWLAGTVVEIIPERGATIEADVSLIQGIFGIGGEANGPLACVCAAPTDDLTPDRISADHRGAILIGGARITADALRQAVNHGVAAIVTGGIDDQDLRDFLGYDLGVATTGSEQLGLTLIITEGFGDIAMARQTFQLLSSRAGSAAAVNGATQIRAGVVRPEIVIPWPPRTGIAGTAAQGAALPDASPIPTDESYAAGGLLEPGALVRIIRDPYFGMLGTVSALPPEPQVLGSGSKARVLEVLLDAGERVIVPRANVELLEL